MSTSSSQRGIVHSARTRGPQPANLARSTAPEFKRSTSGVLGESFKPVASAKPRPKNFMGKIFDQPELEPTTEDIRRKSPYSGSFKYERPIFLGELGDGKILKNVKSPSSSKVILKTFAPNSTKERDQLIRQIKFYKQMDCASILKVLDFEVRTESAYCSMNYFIDVYLETFDKTLEAAIQERQPSHLLFSNESLERLLYDVGFALHHYCKHNIVHGCVDARHITIQEVEGEIVVAKLVPMIGLEETPLQLYRKNILFQTEHTVAPEIFDQAKLLFKDEFEASGIDFLKLDGFSLGMVLLRTGLLDSVMRVYAKPTFDTEILASYLASFEEAFSDGGEGQKLITSVQSLLRVGFNERPYPSELLQQLNAINSDRLTRQPEFIASQDGDTGSRVQLSRKLSGIKFTPMRMAGASSSSQERDEPNQALSSHFFGFQTVKPMENPLHRKYAQPGLSKQGSVDQITVRELSKDSKGESMRSISPALLGSIPQHSGGPLALTLPAFDHSRQQHTLPGPTVPRFHP